MKLLTASAAASASRICKAKSNWRLLMVAVVTATFSWVFFGSGAQAQTDMSNWPPPAQRNNVQAVAAAAASTPAATPAPTQQQSSSLPQTAPGDGRAGQLTETEIVATNGAEFDGRTRQAIFRGQVHVADPRFELWCDQLTVFLNKDTKDNEPGDRLPPRDSNNDEQSGGIDRAVAEGHVVIKQTKPATDGGEPKTSIGRSERADFTNRTGEIVLTGGPPSVQQGLNVLEATSSRTHITMTRDNTLRTDGPSRTVIRQRGDDTNKPVTTNRRNNNAAGGATPAPNAGTNNRRPRRGAPSPAPRAPGQ